MAIYKKTAIIGVCVLLLQIITSLTYVGAQESLMATLDKDHDGVISLREAAGHAKLLERFNQIDLNEDGYISMDELTASDISQG